MKAAAKRQLRERLKEIRSCLPPDRREECSRTIRDRLLGLLDDCRTVMVYVSKEPEVETLPLIEALLEAGIEVVVPVIQPKSRTLRLSYLKDPAVLVPSTFRVPEPVGAEIPADAESVEAVVIPLIGFDRFGGRLGYGAGYYDRFLEAHPAVMKIGVAFSCQEITEVPAEPFDIRLDVIVTEEKVIRCNGTRPEQ